MFHNNSLRLGEKIGHSFQYMHSFITFYKFLKLFHLAKSLPTLCSVTKPPGPRYAKNVEPQRALFDLTSIEMSTSLSLSISDIKSYLVKLWRRHHKRSRGRTNPFILGQRGRAVRGVPEVPLWERANN